MHRQITSIQRTTRVLAVGLLALASHMAGAADGGQVFKAQCVACHGPNGQGNTALQAPPLAGLDSAYTVRQLRNFRTRVRGGDAPHGAVTAMQAAALAIADDANVLALGSYVGSLRPITQKTSADRTGVVSLNSGKALFGVCVSCHGGQGEGAPALAAPRITHLPAWYISTQLQAYRSGRRGSHPDDLPGQQMRQIATEALADDEAVAAVVAYIVALGSKLR